MKQNTPWLPWLVILSAALFFFYEFMQMNLMSGISDAVMADLQITATQFGWLSSAYFLANVLFLLVAGILLDRFSTRRIVLSSLLVCIAGIILFASADGLVTAMIARFLSGIGSAFCFLSVIRLASRWFPPQKMAFVTGCIVTMAMAGALVAQTPLTLLLQHFTWRPALLINAGIGIVIFLAIASVVKDFPAGHSVATQQERLHLRELGYLRSMRLAFFRGQNWLAGGYVCLMNLIVVLLGGTWGKLYLMNAQRLSALNASYVTSLLFIGAVIGGPLAGWISDRLRLRRLPMMAGAFICLALVSTLMLYPLGFTGLLLLFLAMGIATSTQVIGYPYAAENSPRLITAMSVSVVNITTQAGLFFAEPLFGYLMDLNHSGGAAYTAADFHWALLLFPLSFVVSIGMVLKLRETNCQRLPLSTAGAASCFDPALGGADARNEGGALRAAPPCDPPWRKVFSAKNIYIEK